MCVHKENKCLPSYNEKHNDVKREGTMKSYHKNRGNRELQTIFKTRAITTIVVVD